MDIFSKSGGYRKLDSFTLATIIQLGTLRFCRKFLNRTNDPCGRQFDQMTQAARSGRANIIEGSERSATSKETEMKLTDVAKASLGELRGDYEMWLLSLGQPPWKRDSSEAQAVFDISLEQTPLQNEHESAVHLLRETGKFSRWLDSEDSATAANALLILIGRAINMLNNQLKAQGEAFKKEGGFREKLHEVRVESRAVAADAPNCPDCEAPMVKRKAGHGKYAGQDFWGCAKYREGCRGRRPCEG